MARMTDEQEERRKTVENALGALSGARMVMQAQVKLRLRQAVQRDVRLHDLLMPALDYLDDVAHAIDLAHSALGEEWHSGQASGWEVEK